jgi:DNA modification methylase
MFSQDKRIITTGKQNLGMWYEIEEPEEVAVWVHKNGVSGGRVSNLSLWEPIVFYGKYDRNSRPSNLFEYELKEQDTGKEHSCPKQIAMIADIVRSYSKENELWLDVFGGSGTTLIACEQLNRTCYMMELDPKYCDVIRKRYAKFLGRENEWQDITPALADIGINE